MSEPFIPQILELADGLKCVRLEDFLREHDELRENNQIMAKNAMFWNQEAEKARRERDEARGVLQEIANASHFDNIGNWARNKAKEALNSHRFRNRQTTRRGVSSDDWEMEGGGMTERPTPQTDALWRSLNTGDNQPSWWVVAEKMRDLACRLEARSRFFERGFHTYSAGVIEYLIERDDARKKRDEVREENKKLIAFVESLVDVLGPHTDIKGSSVIPAAYAILRNIKEAAK